MKRLLNSLPIGALGRQLVHGGLLGLLVRVLSVLAGLLSSAVLARVLGPAEYGVYAFVFAIIAILALLVQMGLPTLVVRETAKAVAHEDWPLLRGIWSWATKVSLVIAVGVLGAVLAWLHMFGAVLPEDRFDALLWGLPLIPLLAFGEVRGAALRGLKLIFQGSFPDQVLRPVLLAGFVGATFAIFAVPVTAKIALALSALAAFLAFLLGTVLLLRAQPVDLKLTAKRRTDSQAWFRSILPLSMITGLQGISQNADLVMLGFLSSDADVGLYRIALSVSTLTVIGVTALNMLVQPYIARLYAKAEFEKLQKLISGSAFMACAVTLPVILIFILGGHGLLVLIFGVQYSGAHISLVILSIGLISTAFFGMAGVLLAMAGYERRLLILLSVSTTLNVFMNALLIPVAGIEGAAIATSISQFILNFQLYFVARKVTGIDSTPISFISGYFVKNSTSSDNFL